jgi:hypothetical protein
MRTAQARSNRGWIRLHLGLEPDDPQIYNPAPLALPAQSCTLAHQPGNASDPGQRERP